jgi:hypothetical protein
VDGWDSYCDHDFYVRAYSDRLESKRFLVKRYTTSFDHIRRFKILGTKYEVTIRRGITTTSHTLSVGTHNLEFDKDTSTEDIVCTALTDEGFILLPEDIDSSPLF